MIILLLQQSSKLPLDSSSSYFEKITAESFFSLNNPIVFSIIVIVLIVIIIYLVLKFIIIPMQKKHLQYQRDAELQQAQLLAMFAEYDPDPVIRFDYDGVVRIINQLGNEFTEYNSNSRKNVKSLFPELKGVDIQYIIDNEDKYIFTAERGGKHFKFTLTGISKLRIGQIYGTDITELKEKETQLLRALEKAEESEKLKSYFLSQMSHEIRTPLNAILGFTDVLKHELGDDVPEELGPVFDSIEKSGRRLYRTIDLNLNMSTVLSGGFKLMKQKALIDDSLQPIILEYRAYAKEKRLIFEYRDLTDRIPYALDVYTFQMIATNIIDNAVKYTREGSIFVEVRILNDETLYFYVRDSGIGMSQDFKNKLFLPFIQEEMGYSRAYEGNGLGLALCKRLLDLINGSIEVQSEKGVGSTFIVKIPVNT